MQAEASFLSRLVPRQGYHTQDPTAGGLVEYWGYAVRVLPCTNDQGTCEYLESVYGGHERGMLYTGILWATIVGILLLWAVGRHFWEPRRALGPEDIIAKEGRPTTTSSLHRMKQAVTATIRRFLLPDSVRFIFGRTTRLQVLILVLLMAYLGIFTFIGIWYKTWITPVKGYDNLYQKRSWLGAWSDRLGVLAFALTPFSVMLASRESILSLLTGMPYQSFNFLHRWLGWIIAAQSIVHALGWTLIETVDYQPQPDVAVKWINQLYMIWGCVAICVLLLLVLLATPWAIRITGYELFRKSHYLLAMVYIGACWGHWKPLKVFMIPGLAIWLVDRAARLIRSFLIHYQYLPDGSMSFRSAPATVTLFPDADDGDIVRLEFTHPQAAWKPGQHFFLCFAKASVWQSHPFTPLNLPVEKDGVVEHSYIFRARGGETRKIADMATASLSLMKEHLTTPVVMQGPYGEDHVLHLTPEVNILCVAGGTGITYALPTLLWLAMQPMSPERRVSLVWTVRRRKDIDWVRGELEKLSLAKRGIEITIYVTRESQEEVSAAAFDDLEKEAGVKSSASSVTTVDEDDWTIISGGHPDMGEIVPWFVDANIRGRTTVIASGPGAMISDLRTHIARVNSGGQVLRGNERADVQLVCDNRLEW